MPTLWQEQRDSYLPTNLKLIFVLESPPAGGGYFYNPDGRVSEILFRAMMSVVLGYKPETKAEGLRRFADAGYLLINPIYVPVDKLPDREADVLILSNYPDFTRELRTFMAERDIPLILIKSNIVRLLEAPLLRDGFRVLNQERAIPFPMHYHMEKFARELKAILP